MSAAPSTEPPRPPPLGVEEQPRLRTVVTPEGVPISFELARTGDRLAAFGLDVLVIVGVLVLIVLLPLVWLKDLAGVSRDTVIALALLALFLVRTFYFAFFELAWQGQTPGKRRLRLRAIDANGGRLTAEAIVARNLTREVELFLPIVACLAPQVLFLEAPGWARVVAFLWMLLFGFLPLVNRDRLRVGDLLAGTTVIRVPDARLLDDLTGNPKPAPGIAGLAFSDAQLDVYGTYELQVLERLLRDRGKAGSVEGIATVALAVRRKIGWAGPAVADGPFLEAFYSALRGRLERRLLFGKRRADKHDRSG